MLSPHESDAPKSLFGKDQKITMESVTEDTENLWNLSNNALTCAICKVMSKNGQKFGCKKGYDSSAKQFVVTINACGKNKKKCSKNTSRIARQRRPHKILGNKRPFLVLIDHIIKHSERIPRKADDYFADVSVTQLLTRGFAHHGNPSVSQSVDETQLTAAWTREINCLRVFSTSNYRWLIVSRKKRNQRYSISSMWIGVGERINETNTENRFSQPITVLDIIPLNFLSTF